MNKPDPGTPIFGELNNELGGLPEIDVHEFDSHSFDFGGESGESGESEQQDTAAATQSGQAAQTKSATRSGGRRRKED